MTTPTDDRRARGACEAVQEDDRIYRYLSGKLSGGELDAFEAHYFDCDACWRSVQAALEVRAAFGVLEPGRPEEPAEAIASATGRPPQRVRSPSVLIWAAGLAAVVAGVAVSGVWRARSVTGSGDVFRGTDSQIAVETASLSGEELTLSWTPDPAADVYVVRVQTADGSLLLQRQVGASRLRIGGVNIPKSSEDSHLFLRVEALDALRRTIARTDLTRIDVAPR